MTRYDYSATIQKAAMRVRATGLQPLYRICEEQKSISTSRLRQILDVLADDMRQDGIHFRALADQLKKQ